MTVEPLHLFPHLLDWLQPISDGLTRVFPTKYINLNSTAQK